MVKIPTDRERYLSFQNAQNAENVLLQSARVATRYGLNHGRIELLETLHCGVLDCVGRGDRGCNAATLPEAISHELCCVRRACDLPGFCMMPDRRKTLPFRAGVFRRHR
jgi:hypothetical protein